MPCQIRKFQIKDNFFCEKMFQIQERKQELVYVVVAFNNAGDGMDSNVVAATL
jgi:hypothetical protein